MLGKLFLQILNMSFTASGVIVLVLLLRIFFQKAPKIFSYAIWSVVVFRLVCPYSFESVFSLLPVKSNPIAQDLAFMQSPTIDTGIAITNNSLNALLPAATPYQSINPLQMWLFIGGIIWVIGIFLMINYSLVTLSQLKNRLKTATAYKENIFISDKIDSAFVLGFFRPKIYLPTALTCNQREYILLHEQTHIKRFDHLVKILSFFVLCLHWFNPFVWIAFFASAKDMEMSCDETVVHKLGNEIKKEYSSSLLSLATDRRIIGATPLAFGEGDTKGRIKNVLSYKKPALWVVLVATAVAVTVALGLLANPKNTDNETESVNAVILEIDKNAQTMTVEGIDENSVIGNKCIVRWEKDALATLATSSGATKLTIDDFSVGNLVVLRIKEVQETYPTTTTATNIYLQPDQAAEIWALRPMVMINGILYLDTGKEGPMGDSGAVNGSIKSTVAGNEKPTEHEQSNFGFVGSEYAGEGDFIQVNIDDKWIVFEAETPPLPTTFTLYNSKGETLKYSEYPYPETATELPKLLLSGEYTQQPSVSDVPMGAEEYLKITLGGLLDDGTYFAYKAQDKFWVEKPYDYKCEIDENEYSTLMSYLAQQ